MRVLVLGGYGLIGLAVVRRLLAAGHAVTGLGRNVAAPARMVARAHWIAADIATLTEPAHWSALLEGIDAVVNCAGALQDGLRDDVAAVHATAMKALFAAAAASGGRRIVQISAPAAAGASATSFMHTKADADAALAASNLEWMILRPGLVLAPAAYGASALLRGLASFPLVCPVALGDARVRTVHVDDVAGAVAAALAGRVALRRAYDLVEEREHTLADIQRQLRAWQGRRPVPAIRLPRRLVGAACRAGDLLGWLGWRTPVRTTALIELEAGIGGDPAPWSAAGGPAIGSLAESLERLPSTVQERWYGRAWLAKPLLLATLAVFWLATGLITLCRLDASAGLLTATGIAGGIARPLAAAGAILDIALGAAVLVRSLMPAALVGMVAASAAYLALGTWLAPALWLDPLGPYLKVLPAAVLALAGLAVAEER